MNKQVKKVVSLVLTVIFVLSSAFTMTACQKGNAGEEDNRRVLKWEVLKAGFGTVPYEKLAEAFMKEHEDILVKINFNPSITSSTAARLESNTNLADVYSYKSISSIKRWAAQGWVEPLDDVYETVLSTGKTIRESMIGTTTEACSYNGTVYAIPEYISMTGFVYNKSLFDEYGWKIPTTTAELEKLCRTILTDTDGAVAPIVYCGGAADGYLYCAVDNWVYEYEGIGNLDTFYAFENPEVYNPNHSKGKMYALQNLQKFFYDEGNYTMVGSTGMTHIVAQSKLIQGEAAMMVNGMWFENEMSAVLEANPDAELAMFAIPEVSDTSGKVLHAEGYTTEDNKRVLAATYGSNYFIPANAANKEDAKTFLAFLNEPESCLIYTRYTNAIRPLDYELSSEAEEYSEMSSFGKSILDMADACYLYVPDITNPISVKGLAGFWARGRRPFTDIRDGIETINQALQNDYEYALNNWESWLSMLE